LGENIENRGQEEENNAKETRRKIKRKIEEGKIYLKGKNKAKKEYGEGGQI
jgi:hypothetical protein